MKILVTGGTGYIGSHTILELIKEGHEVDIVDNLFNSKITVLDKIEKLVGTRPGFFKKDLREDLAEIFEGKNYDLVMHFAGLKAVGESVQKPLEYYEANIGGTVNLLKNMQKYGVNKIVFSSSATVYGVPEGPRCKEDMKTGQEITNPYGRTKYMIEEILKDVAISNPDFSATILRYFNPVGNDESGELGEDPNGIPNNLMPIIMKVARGEIAELTIYGDDYETKDGTCLRDYIHVSDLAKGHVAAIKAMKPGISIFNLGTGQTTSVMEMIASFEKAAGKKLPHKIGARRDGDLPELCADPQKAHVELNWQTEKTIEDAMRDTIKFLNN